MAGKASKFEAGLGASILSAEMAGELLMIGGERVRQLHKAGWIKKGSMGFRLIDVVHGYIQYRNDAERRSTKSAAANRVTDMRAREIELRVARREAELLERDDALEVVDELVGIFLSALSSIPPRLTREIRERRHTEGVMHDVQTEVAQACRQKIASLGPRGDDARVEPDANAGPMGGSESSVPEHVGDTGTA
jgi:hypothetical protein